VTALRASFSRLAQGLGVHETIYILPTLCPLRLLHVHSALGTITAPSTSMAPTKTRRQSFRAPGALKSLPRQLMTFCNGEINENRSRENLSSTMPIYCFNPTSVHVTATLWRSIQQEKCRIYSLPRKLGLELEEVGVLIEYDESFPFFHVSM
jgi:hypothetical protein